MNISIRKQLTVIFSVLMAVMFLANYLVNSCFLESFYYLRKQEKLLQAYQMLNEYIDGMGRFDQEEMQALNALSNENGISYLVTDLSYNELLWTESVYTSIMKGRLNGYGIGVDTEDVTVLDSNDSYTIQKKYDSKIGLNYLEMWGTLNKGFYFIMRINIEGIRDSVRISNEFIKYICLVGIVLTALIVWAVTKHVTKPLKELTELSKRMAELDFGVKYTSGGTNEVGQLGAHFNEMSDRLEQAYSQLLSANNELQKDIEKKQKIDSMRQEFLSNVSHELKTPIALIQGYAEGLQECINDDPESREFYCEVIVDEASRMNGLVQKLLALNQLEFGNDETEMVRFDLGMLIRNKIQSVTILAQQKNAEITYEGDDSLAVWGDEFKVEEVLTNYLSNALNHVDGACQIRVTAELLPAAADDPAQNASEGPLQDAAARGRSPVEAGAQRVRVTVFNTGEPIPQEDIGRIWDKFYKVDKARTRAYGGSGVGLSIVKAIMESFHQKYGVENRENGVAFWFELPSGGSLRFRGERDGRTDKPESQATAAAPAEAKVGAGNFGDEVCDGEWRPDNS